MQENATQLLVRGIGEEFEDYIFLKSIQDFEEFYLANQENFNIYEVATISEVEDTILTDVYTVHDITLKGSDEHFWLMENNETGMYTPVENIEQAERLIKIFDESEKK